MVSWIAVLGHLAAGVPVLPLFLEDVTTDGAFLGEDPAALELAETFRAEALVQRVPAAGGVAAVRRWAGAVCGMGSAVRPGQRAVWCWGAAQRSSV